VPKRFHLRQDLPMLANGKVDKVMLREWSIRQATQ
jgi:hypothetical protein